MHADQLSHVVEGELARQQEREAQPRPDRLAGEHLVGDALADRQPPGVGRLLHRTRLAHRDRDARIELLPDPRHRGEDRRRDLAHVLRHRLRVLDEIEHRAGVDGEVLAAEPLGDVAERQEAHPLVALVLADDRVVAADRVDDAAVRMHRPLGPAGGARGVDEDREVLGPAGGGALVELSWDASSPGPGRARAGHRARAPADRGSRAGPRCRRRRSSPARAGARAPPAPCRAARRPRRRSPGCSSRRTGTRPGQRRRSGRCRSRPRPPRAPRGRRGPIRRPCWRGSRRCPPGASPGRAGRRRSRAPRPRCAPRSIRARGRAPSAA